MCVLESERKREWNFWKTCTTLSVWSRWHVAFAGNICGSLNALPVPAFACLPAHEPDVASGSNMTARTGWRVAGFVAGRGQQCNTKYYKQAELPSRAKSCCLTPACKQGRDFAFYCMWGQPSPLSPHFICSPAIVLLVKSNLLHTFVRRCNSHKMYSPYEPAVTFAQSHFGSPSLSPPNPAPCHLPRPLIALAVSMCLAFIKVQTVPNRWAWELIENLFHSPRIFFDFSAIYFPSLSLSVPLFPIACVNVAICVAFLSLPVSPVSFPLALPNSNSFALLTVCLHAPVKVQGLWAYK